MTINTGDNNSSENSDAENTSGDDLNSNNGEGVGTNLNQAPFPIIGIGASAGGLEAIQEFFDNMISEPGAAFVVIQHLSPDYKSFMSELLGRHTSIPIKVVKDKMKIEINHIYLIPPKMNMTIRGRVLYLTEIVGRGLNQAVMPISGSA